MNKAKLARRDLAGKRLTLGELDAEMVKLGFWSNNSDYTDDCLENGFFVFTDTNGTEAEIYISVNSKVDTEIWDIRSTDITVTCVKER